MAQSTEYRSAQLCGSAKALTAGGSGRDSLGSSTVDGGTLGDSGSLAYGPEITCAGGPGFVEDDGGSARGSTSRPRAGRRLRISRMAPKSILAGSERATSQDATSIDCRRSESKGRAPRLSAPVPDLPPSGLAGGGGLAIGELDGAEANNRGP